MIRYKLYTPSTRNIHFGPLNINVLKRFPSLWQSHRNHRFIDFHKQSRVIYVLLEVCVKFLSQKLLILVTRFTKISAPNILNLNRRGCTSSTYDTGTIPIYTLSSTLIS